MEVAEAGTVSDGSGGASWALHAPEEARVSGAARGGGDGANPVGVSRSVCYNQSPLLRCPLIQESYLL